MTDERTNEGNVGVGHEAHPSAETKNTDSEHMIPKDRFDEVNRRWKDAEKAREAAEKALKEAQVARLQEQEDYKALYEQTTTELSELKPKAEQFDSYQETLQRLLDAQVDDIPEHLRSLIPDEMSVKQKLDWIAKNKRLLAKPTAPDIGAGQRGAAGSAQSVELTPEEKEIARRFGYSEEEYAKYKLEQDAY